MIACEVSGKVSVTSLQSPLYSHLSILSAKPFENGAKCSGEKRLKNTASRLKSTKPLFKVRKSG